MPIVFTIGSMLFFFTSYDCYEPVHIHIVDGGKECKYWLEENQSIRLADNRDFKKSELLKLRRIVEENYELIKTTWYEHCKDTPFKTYKKKRNK